MSSAVDTDVLVLGASFSGIELLYQLMRYSEGRLPRTTVVDRATQHGYLPLVQERLCGRLDPQASTLDTATYVRSLPQTRFVQDEIVGLDPDRKEVELASGARIRARFIVVALGSTTDPPAGFPGAEHVLSYKDGPDFERTRLALERTSTLGDGPPVIAVIGAGISGVELAAELADLAREHPRGWRAPEVALIASSDRVLPEQSPRLSAVVTRHLERQRVTLRLRTRVQAAHAGGLTLAIKGSDDVVDLPTSLSIWAGGVRPAPVLSRLELPHTDAGWLAVGPTLQCFATAEQERPDIFACGDAVRVLGGDGEWPTMQRAIECIWQAKIVAQNLLRLAKEPPDYPNGVPPLLPHRLREHFFYGVSLGARSLIAYRGLGLDLPGVNHRFRRWLMGRYFARYRPEPRALGAAANTETAE